MVKNMNATTNAAAIAMVMTPIVCLSACSHASARRGGVTTLVIEVIDGPTVQKIELSERLAKILSYEDQADAALAAAAA